MIYYKISHFLFKNAHLKTHEINFTTYYHNLHTLWKTELYATISITFLKYRSNHNEVSLAVMIYVKNKTLLSFLKKKQHSFTHHSLPFPTSSTSSFSNLSENQLNSQTWSSNFCEPPYIFITLYLWICILFTLSLSTLPHQPNSYSPSRPNWNNIYLEKNI